MNAELMSAIQRATIVALTAYGPAELCDNAPHANHGKPVSIAVGFTGRSKGSVELQVTGAAFGELAAAMFEQAELPPDASPVDAISEMANVIAGNILRTLDSERAFSLDPPRVLESQNSRIPSAAAAFDVGEGQVSVRLFLDS